MGGRRMGAVLGAAFGAAAGLAGAPEFPAVQVLLRALAAAALGYGLGSVVFGPFGRGLLGEGASGGAGTEKDSIGTKKG